MSKRTASESDKAIASAPGGVSAGGTTAAKRPRITGSTYISATEEALDVNILRFQNKRIASRLIARQKLEQDLRNRIEQLETKQTSADAIVYVISRYWNQLNEDLRILLSRFDAETTDENESNNEAEATKSFLAGMDASQFWDADKEEEELALKQRVESSTRAVRKILQAFDRVVQRNEKITLALKDEGAGKIDEAVLAANIELQQENKNLQNLVTELHAKLRSQELEANVIKDKISYYETSNDELKNRIDDVEFDLNMVRNRELRVEELLAEARAKLVDMEAQAEMNSEANAAKCQTNATNKRVDAVSAQKLEELQKDLEEQRDLAQNRLQELEQLNAQHKETLKVVENLKMEMQCLPEQVIMETVEYKCLQSNFSVLFNESMQLKTQLEEARNQLQTSKNNHLRQIEHMESEELNMQKRLRTETIQLEDNLAQVRREYEMLRLEFEQMHAVNEQTGPINREMRHLITSLQNHNHQLKGEVRFSVVITSVSRTRSAQVNRWKRKHKEAMHEVQKMKHALEQAQQKASAAQAAAAAASAHSSHHTTNDTNALVKVEPKTETDSADESKVKRELWRC